MAATTPPSTSGSGTRLFRFDLIERVLHWSTALLMGVLFATGAILYIPSLSEAVGRRLLIANVHTWCGIALFAALLAALAGPWGTRLRRDLHRLGRISGLEWRWLRRLGGVEVRLGKFNPGQKLNAALLGSGLTVLLASGLVLRFPGPFALDWRTGSTFVHDWFALGIVLLVSGHVAFALTHPEALRAMVRGWVTRNWRATTRRGGSQRRQPTRPLLSRHGNCRGDLARVGTSQRVPPGPRIGPCIASRCRGGDEMAVQLNHTIVASTNKQASAAFLARILGLPEPGTFGHFVTVEVSNGVSLDFDDKEKVTSQHYAFLVDDEDFEPIFERVRGEGIEYFADPADSRAGEINTCDRGRGFYFADPDGHNLEVLTRRYGS